MPTPVRQQPKPMVKPTTKNPTRTSKQVEEDPWGSSDGLRMLLYGSSGTGKTTFAATFPGTIRWYLCSGGKKPGELRSINTPTNRKRISPKIVTSFNQFKQLLQEDEGQFENYVLDHVSGLADLVLGDIIGKPIPQQKGWGLASQQQYGQQGLQMKEVLKDLMNMSGNIVVIGQERTFGGKDDGMDPELIKPTVGVALTPSVAGWLNPACDYVVQAFKRPRMVKRVRTVAGKEVAMMERGKGVEYCLRCEEHDVFMTKFRVPGGVQTDVIVDPTYDKVMEVINAGQSEE